MLSRLPRHRSTDSHPPNSRFECKYHIDPLILPALRQFVQSVAGPDPFSASRADRRYPVCSLYLDTDDLLFYQQYVQGERCRCKLRVRTYSDDPATPAYLEVKARVNGVVSKQRAALSRQEARLVVGRHPTAAAARHVSNRAAFDYFVTEMALTCCKPVVRVRYMREAYASAGHEPVRVTFDTDVQHQATFSANLSHDGGRWLPTPVDGVVLEIKFTGRFPSWIEHMVRAFGLKQDRCSKFASSIEQMLARGEATQRCGRFTLPPASVAARI